MINWAWLREEHPEVARHIDHQARDLERNDANVARMREENLRLWDVINRLRAALRRPAEPELEDFLR